MIFNQVSRVIILDQLQCILSIFRLHSTDSYVGILKLIVFVGCRVCKIYSNGRLDLLNYYA